MAIKNLQRAKSFNMFNFTNTVRTGWSAYRNITLGNTLRKASLKGSTKPYHKSYISKSSAANCIKADSIRRGGVRADRRQSECDQAAKRLRICNRALDEYCDKRLQYHIQYQRSVKDKVPVLTRKLKDIMAQVYNPTRAESTMRLPNHNSSQLSCDSEWQHSREPDFSGQHLLEAKAATNRATNSKSNQHAQAVRMKHPDIHLLEKENRKGKKRMWQLGSRTIPCLDL